MATSRVAPVTQPTAAQAAPISKKQALWSGGIYTAASAIPRVIGFILLPVYTRVLSPSDYGQLSVALAASAVAIVVFSLGLEIAVFRNLFQLADDLSTRQRFIRSIWTFLLVTPLVLAALVSLALAPVLSASHVLSAPQLALSLVGAAIFISATTVPLAVLRAEQRLREYVLVNAVATVATTSLILILVVGVSAGVTGWLCAVIIGNLVTLIVSIRILPYGLPNPFDREMVRDALRLSLPVMPHFAAMWSLQLADRVLVAAILSTAATGLYSLASNLALPMMMIVVGFGYGFMPAYAHAGKTGDREGSLAGTIGLQVGLICTLCVAWALLSPAAVHLLASPRYASASALTAWIVLGYGFLGLYQIPMNAITLTHGRTKGLAMISGTGAIVNIGLIVAFAPRYGLEAVAIASALGYAALLLAVSVFASSRHATLPYPWRSIAVVVVLSLCGYAGGALTSGATTALDVAVRLCWIAATIIGVGIALVDRGNLQVPYGDAFSRGRNFNLLPISAKSITRRAKRLLRRHDAHV